MCIRTSVVCDKYKCERPDVILPSMLPSTTESPTQHLAGRNVRVTLRASSAMARARDRAMRSLSTPRDGAIGYHVMVRLDTT